MSRNTRFAGGSLVPVKLQQMVRGGLIMNRYFENSINTHHVMAPSNMHEIVRGQEDCFIEKMEPLVRERSVTLDLRQVERIDAAGIAALISLYGTAHAAGHDFTIVNASHHVAEILALVGLDRILIAPDQNLNQNEVPCPQGEPCYEMPAA
jgi:anti-anti-sigma factor